MADNISTVAAGNATLPADTDIAVRKVTYSGDAEQAIAPVGLVVFSGSDDAKIATDVTDSAPLPVVHAELITKLQEVIDALGGELSVAATGAMTVTGDVAITEFPASGDTAVSPLSFNATASGDTPVTGMAAPASGTQRIIYYASLHNNGAEAIMVGLRDGAGGTYLWGPAMLAPNGGGSLLPFGPNGGPLSDATSLVINLGATGNVTLNVVDHATRLVPA